MNNFFWLALHHAIGDGQSVGTLFEELTITAGRWRTAASGRQAEECLRPANSPTLPHQTPPRTRNTGSTCCKGAPDAAFDEWPLDMARSSQTPPGNHRLEVVLDPQTTAGLKALARSHESSLHSLMLALLAMEASRRTGRPDILIGTTASVRELASDARIVGYSVNMLPLHLRPQDRQCFGDLLRATQQSLAAALQHARYPFARIYRAFWSERPDLRHPLRYPLFDIAVTENPGTGQNDAPQRFTRATMETGSVSYERTDASPGQDMVLIHEVLDEGDILLQLHVNAAIYSEETARSWFTALAGWARWLADDPARAGASHAPAAAGGRRAACRSGSREKNSDRPRLRFHELFERVVDRPGQADCPGRDHP